MSDDVHVSEIYTREYFVDTEKSTCTCVCNAKYCLQYTRCQLTLLFVLTHLLMLFADDVSISRGYKASSGEATKNNKVEKTTKEAILPQFET